MSKRSPLGRCGSRIRRRTRSPRYLAWDWSATTLPAYDGDRREVQHENLSSNPLDPVINNFKYSWDRAGNRRDEDDQAAQTSRGSYYKYDSKYRLTTDVLNLPSSSLTNVDASNDATEVTDPSYAGGSVTSYGLPWIDGGDGHKRSAFHGVLTLCVLFAAGLPSLLVLAEWLGGGAFAMLARSARRSPGSGQREE